LSRIIGLDKLELGARNREYFARDKRWRSRVGDSFTQAYLEGGGSWVIYQLSLEK